jgi:hypothetical protein
MLDEWLDRGKYDLVTYPILREDFRNPSNVAALFKEYLGAYIIIIFNSMNFLALLINVFPKGGKEV